MTNAFRLLLLLALSFNAQMVFGQPSKAQPALAMEQSVELAERFVRENGYTNASADQIKAELTSESVEVFLANREQVLALRRNELKPKAIGAKATDSGWGVAFDYSNSQSDSCRVVVMQQDGSKIRMTHQDGIREYWVGFKAK